MLRNQTDDVLEVATTDTPKSSKKLLHLNCSHPPLQKMANPSTPITVGGNSKSVCTPKFSNRTPGGLRNSNRKSASSYPVSEDNLTPSGKTNLRITLNSPLRRSAGNSQKSSRPVRRCSSARRSSMHMVTSSPSANAFTVPHTPQDHHRPYHRFGSTPNALSAESVRLRRSDVNKNAFLDMANLEQIDESSPVSVGVRVRPFNERELSRNCIKNIVEVRNNEIFVIAGNGSFHSFAYDNCFWSCDRNHPSYASQNDVYVKMAKPLLEHSFEGYNVCLFAYGQTGSGKSYCIMGEGPEVTYDDDLNLQEEVGIIPRFCHDLFKECNRRLQNKNDLSKGSDFRVLVEVSYIEIYNEKIYDLIGCHQPPTPSRTEEDARLSGNCIGERREALRVREHPQTGPYIVGASCHLVTTYQDLQTWLVIGNKQRSIAATGMNDKSSRSHSVFSIKLTQRQVEDNDGEKLASNLVSTINIVDLAGSERVASSYSEGDRLREGVCINKSLLTLGKVITALAESGGKRKVFIPYRESVLTFLLKESLGGNSKTSMIATISPCDIHQEETLSTLRYAHQARKIVNWNHVNEDPAARVIRTLKREVERLRAQQLSSPCALQFGSDESDAEDVGLSSPNIENKSHGDADQQKILEEKRKKFEEEKHLEQMQIKAKEEEICALKQKLKVTQEQMRERTRAWEQKLVDAEARKKEALEMCKMNGLALKITNNEPALVNLCDDPQLSQTLLYSLSQGSTSLGQCHADVTLRNLHSKDIHCTIKNEDGKLMLFPGTESETFINGKLTTAPTQIFHNDRIVLSGIYYFRVSCPSSAKNPLNSSEERKEGKRLDFYFARDELLREQKERLQKEMVKQKAAVRDEVLKEFEEHREIHKLQSQHLDQNLKSLSAELEHERQKNKENELLKLRLREEKQFLEEQMSKFNEAPSLSPQELESPQDLGNPRFLNEVESLFNESMQLLESDTNPVDPNDVELWFLITEANNICHQLKKPFEFKQQSVLTSNGLETCIIISDLEHNLSASLSVSKFRSTVGILRDLSLGHEDENIFETSLCWERKEEATQLPFLIDKLKENYRRLSLNSSLNASLGNALSSSANNSSFVHPQKRKLTSSRRRSSLLQNSLRGPSNGGASGSAPVAKAASAVLSQLTLPTSSEAPLQELVKEIIQLTSITKAIQKQNKEPLPTASSDDQLNIKLVQLSGLIQVVSKSLVVAGSLSLPHSSSKHSDMQAALSSMPPKLSRKVIRLLQGIETEVEGLVEEECTSLINLMLSLSEDIGFLSVIGGVSLMESSSLATSADVCQSYLCGVSKGLEWQVESAATASQNASDLLLSPPEGGQHIESLSKSAHIAASRTAQFLDQFAQLKVIPTLDSTMDPATSALEVNRFLTRVGMASDNARQLVASLATVTLQLREGSFKMALLGEAVMQLQESLGELVDDAGIGSSFQKEAASLSSSSINSSEASANFFLENLHASAMKALKSIKSFTRFLSELEAKHGASTETLCQVETPSFSSAPLKSSLRGSNKGGDEKRVRFNVSFTGSSSFGSSPQKLASLERDLEA